MTVVEMVLPQMGESVMEATILTWTKKVGDSVNEDEPLLEVATDKVDTEVPSLYTGTVKELLVNEGEVVQIGNPVALIEIDGELPVSKKEEPDAAKDIMESVAQATDTVALADMSERKNLMKSEVGKFYSPLVLNIAKAEGVSIEELDALDGTGKDGRVTKRDVIALVRSKKNRDTSYQVSVGEPKGASIPEPQQVNVFDGNDEIIEMDRMRKMIADRMLDSVKTSPHVTSFVEADVTDLVAWRGSMKRKLMDEEGQALTFTPIFLEAIAKAIRDYPMINVQVDGDKIIRKGDINIGMAVALPNGNLIVPVIHKTDQLSLRELTRKVNDLARRARKNKLTADDLADGTYTVSNIGGFGNVMGTPILVQPQVGILALGAITKKAAVIETPAGDAIAIRHKMFMSHSYDHRVVDGALGGMFVKRVADYLEKFDLERDI
ncbi:dihydrolipoamide acetyltransferase family protein [Reichenbachiella versicolor]|uniref:dihydrolipoamide acetyltransferase family protein n=1 Tax=Reichenbachiella versicolor TaxID=1821036 RepID=UPI000D6E3898|nr:dihydrolipoamide acetyltransferase family protein [Reichenbachiella versicolor]